MFSFVSFTLKTFTYFLPSFIMLCLSTWSGQDLSKASQAQVLPCYAKLGGKYVGKLRFCGSTSAYQVLRDIQEQASKLLKHAWRGFEDIMAWCDNQWLIPSGFAYRDDLTQEEEVQVWAAIQNAKRLEVMWDDNDEYAKAKVSEDTFKVDRDEVQIYLKANKELPREVVGLWKRSRLPVQIYLQRDKELPCEVVTVLKCSQLSHVAFATYLDITDTVAPFAMDLSGLKGTTITKLDLCGIMPTEWQSCEGIQDMRVMNWYGLRVAFGISCLHNLRNLQLGWGRKFTSRFWRLEPYMFRLGLVKQLGVERLGSAPW